LFPHVFLCHVRVRLDGILDMHRHRRHRRHKLAGDGGEELGYLAAVAVTSLEEEAGAEAALVGEAAGHGAGDGGLSGAGHAVEPEDGMCLRLIRGLVDPFGNLTEEIDSGVGVAGRGGTLGVGVESSSVGGGQFVEIQSVVASAYDAEILDLADLLVLVAGLAWLTNYLNVSEGSL